MKTATASWRSAAAKIADMLHPLMIRRVLRYGAVGLASTALYVLLVALLVEVFSIDPVISAIVSCAATIVLAYGLNHRWVFASNRGHTAAFPRFVAATIISLTLNGGIMHVAVNYLAWSYLLGVALTVVIVPPTNFALNYFWCFRQRS